MSKPNLTRLCRAHLEAREEGKAAYTKADALLEQILEAGARPGRDIGAKYRLKDNFAAANKVFRAHGINRYEIEEIK